MKRMLGVDYGERRIGLAVSDPTRMLATPLRTVDVLSVKQARNAVLAACQEIDAGLVVVGLPLNMDGTRGEMVVKVEEFVESLRRRLQIGVETWDERLSTSLVERVLIEADMSRAKRKLVRDKLAAQVILQGYIDAHSE